MNSEHGEHLPEQPVEAERRSLEPDVASSATIDEDEDDEVFTFGAVAESISTLTSVSMEIVLGTGRDKADRRFLVPYMDVNFEGDFLGSFIDSETLDTEDADDAEPDRATLLLTFDNVAYGLQRVAKRYRRLMTTLIEISHDSLGPVPGRVDYTIRHLARASADLAATAREMRELLPPKPAAGGSE